MNQSNNVAGLLEAGNDAFEDEEFEEAIQFYSQALMLAIKSTQTSSDDKAVLYCSRSFARFKSATKNGKSNDAELQLSLEDAHVTIMIRPNWTDGYVQAGRIHRHRKEWDRALERFDEALSLDQESDEIKKYRSGCRLDKMYAEVRGHIMSHGFKDEMEKGTKVEDVDKSLASGVKKVDVPQDGTSSPQAMVKLAVLYMQGTGVKRNITKAVSLFEKAANIDSKTRDRTSIGSAQFYLGLCYESGTGKPVDHVQARHWYDKASASGHAGAANNLAVLWENGQGGEKCSIRAKRFFKLAASRGNRSAMESLAWKHLEDHELEPAEIWYAKALTSGNEHSIRYKEKFDQLRGELRKHLNEFSLERKSRDLVIFNAAIKRACSNKSFIAQFAKLANSPVAKCWLHFQEILNRARDGHPFALRMLMSMTYFAESMHYFKKIQSTELDDVDYAIAQELCIQHLADSLRATEIVVFFPPSDVELLLRIVDERILSGARQSAAAALIASSFLMSVGQKQHPDYIHFIKASSQSHPDEAFFYKMHASSLILQDNYQDSLEVSEEGLKKFPTDDSLLYCRASAVELVNGKDHERVIAAYKSFIEHAPYDDPFVPEAYYYIAYHLPLRERAVYFQKALEAEKKLLPCFLPYESNMKILLTSLQTLGDESQIASLVESFTKSRLKSPERGSVSRVTNAAGGQCFQQHRNALKRLFETSGSEVRQVRLSSKPKSKQKLSTPPDDSTAITLRDMEPLTAMVYNKRHINVVISEDPTFGFSSAFRAVVRDDNDDCIHCTFYRLDQSDANVRKNLAFGSKITILDPCFRSATDGSLALHVDDPKTIIYRAAGQDNPICRYCWNENPPHTCGSCKRVRYCSQDCQTDDWKIRKHKLICGLKYFDSGM